MENLFSRAGKVTRSPSSAHPISECFGLQIKVSDPPRIHPSAQPHRKMPKTLKVATGPLQSSTQFQHSSSLNVGTPLDFRVRVRLDKPVGVREAYEGGSRHMKL